MDEAAEDEARSEQQLFALSPSPVDMAMLDSFSLIVSQIVQSKKGSGWGEGVGWGWGGGSKREASKT